MCPFATVPLGLSVDVPLCQLMCPFVTLGLLMCPFVTVPLGLSADEPPCQYSRDVC